MEMRLLVLDTRSGQSIGQHDLAAFLPVMEFGTSPPECVGDCDGHGTVNGEEIIALVSIALGTADRTTCPSGIPPRRC